MTERQIFGTSGTLNRRWMALCGASVLALGTTLVPGTWAWDDAKPAQPAGLRGVLPIDVPATLGEDAFATLDGNWKEWGEKTAAEVAKLYSEEMVGIEAQRLQLDVLKKKLLTMETSLKDARYRSIHEPLGSLYSALNRRVAIAEAVLDTLTIDPQKAASEKLDGVRQQVAKSLKDLETEMNTVKNGPAWLDYVRSAEITKLVSDKKGVEAVPVLSAVQKKLSPSDVTSPEVRKFLDGSRLVALRQSLDEFVTVAAVVDQPYNPEKLRTDLVALVGSIEQFEESQSSSDAAAVRKTFDTVRKSSPDHGNRVASAMSTHYFNFNLRVVASEKFLSKIASETTTKQGQIRDVILGANVSGNQTTTVTAGVDLKPSNDGIRLNLVIDGVARSSTVGVTDQASVYTSGNHVFKAWKPILFDGNTFTAGAADISVRANNQTTGVSTRYSNIPLFGGFADSIAMNEVAERRGQSEVIASQRISSKVLPEFNTEVDAKIVDLNKNYEEKVNAKLRQKELYPSAASYRSTEDDLRVSTRLMADHELSGGDGPFVSVPSSGFVVALHESLLNNSLDRLKIAGRTMTEDELGKEIEDSFSDLLGRKLNMEKKTDDAADGSKESATFVFPEKDALRFRINNGQLTLAIRAGLKQKDGDIPTQEITVPLMFRIEGTDFLVESGEISVSPVEAPANAGLQIARAGVVRNKVKNALPTRKFDRFVNIDKDRQTPIQLGLAQVKAAGGWLTLSFE
ncbi:MAG: hypothetical protein DWI21_16640 [Planctomycetota bacterium]|nr:MAG: hypothetical protein DWI21_16640 [Planctomycetota bacterium]GDY06714.1 hypothetical protein LBMAG52_02000 [Planctomycetia bacterium]